MGVHQLGAKKGDQLGGTSLSGYPLPMFLRWFLLTIISLYPYTGQASSSGAQQAFQQGIKAYQQQNFQGASDFFRKSLSLNSENPMTLYNLGLSEYRQEKKGWALGHWRKALSVSPEFELAEKALEFAQSRMPGGLHFSESSYWEDLRLLLLNRVSLNKFLAITWIFLFSGGLLMIRYFIRRRIALKTETPLPSFPNLGVLCALLFFIGFALSGAKIWDHFVPRATVVTSDIPLHSGPNKEDSVLFDLEEGFEVIVNGDRGDWAQVSFPGGITGWVTKSALLHSSGKAPW